MTLNSPYRLLAKIEFHALKRKQFVILRNSSVVIRMKLLLHFYYLFKKASHFLIWLTWIFTLYPLFPVSHLWKGKKIGVKNGHFLPDFSLDFSPKTTISCGLTPLFSFQATIPHHYYHLDICWVDDNDAHRAELILGRKPYNCLYASFWSTWCSNSNKYLS